MRFNSDRTVVPLPDHERLPGGSVADPLWMNPGRTGLPGSASRGALPAVPTGAGGVVTTADIRAPCSWPPSGAGSHTPAGIDIPDADGLSVGVLPGDGQPRFVWDELAVTVAGRFMTRRRFLGACGDAASVALSRQGTAGVPCGSPSALRPRRRAVVAGRVLHGRCELEVSGNVQKRPNGKWRARHRDAAGREHARHFERKIDAERWLSSVDVA